MKLSTVEEYKTHLRKKIPTFACPTREDRVHIPEEIWQQIDWTEREKFRNAALPHKLWNMRHDDNLWPACHDWRGDDAFGPLAGVGHPKYKQSPPKLVKGRGIARWMNAGDSSIIEIPLLANYREIWTPENIPAMLDVIERQGGVRQAGEHFQLTKAELFATYGPSPLQKFSDQSWLVCDPYHISWHKMIKRREYLGDKIDPEATDKVLFFRYGWRWDSGDDYYVKAATYIGLAWN